MAPAPMRLVLWALLCRAERLRVFLHGWHHRNSPAYLTSVIESKMKSKDPSTPATMIFVWQRHGYRMAESAPKPY